MRCARAIDAAHKQVGISFLARFVQRAGQLRALHPLDALIAIEQTTLDSWSPRATARSCRFARGPTSSSLTTCDLCPSEQTLWQVGGRVDRTEPLVLPIGTACEGQHQIVATQCRRCSFCRQFLEREGLHGLFGNVGSSRAWSRNGHRKDNHYVLLLSLSFPFSASALDCLPLAANI